MPQSLNVALLGSVVIVVYDIVASLLSRRFGWEYFLFSIGSAIIYTAVGYLASKGGPFYSAVLAATLVGLIDVTLGWYISWVIGPGRIESGFDANVFIQSAGFVMAFSATFGGIGGAISRWF